MRKGIHRQRRDVVDGVGVDQTIRRHRRAARSKVLWWSLDEGHGGRCGCGIGPEGVCEGRHEVCGLGIVFLSGPHPSLPQERVVGHRSGGVCAGFVRAGRGVSCVCMLQRAGQSMVVARGWLWYPHERQWAFMHSGYAPGECGATQCCGRSSSLGRGEDLSEGQRGRQKDCTGYHSLNGMTKESRATVGKGVHPTDAGRHSWEGCSMAGSSCRGDRRREHRAGRRGMMADERHLDWGSRRGSVVVVLRGQRGSRARRRG